MFTLWVSWFPNKLTDIPNFKQVVIMATTCTYCGYRTNEVKSGSGVSETGTRIVLRIANTSDLNRDVILVSEQRTTDSATYANMKAPISSRISI